MKIIVAVEDKLFGEAIADFVANHEWPEGSEISVLHVLEPIFVKPLAGYPTELIKSLNEERSRAAKSLVLSVGTAISTKYPHVTVREEILEGHAKDIIVNRAKDWPADLIVVGSHGRSGIGQFFLGSVSMSVLSAAPCSVMVVKLNKKQEETAEESAQKEMAASH
jgi:nucleotide-binding universal stress UspA family protein